MEQPLFLYYDISSYHFSAEMGTEREYEREVAGEEKYIVIESGWSA